MSYCKIIIGDALQYLPTIQAGTVDLVFTDPPYNISSEVVISRGRNLMKFRGPDIVLDYGEWDHFESEEKFLEWTYQWLDKVVHTMRAGAMFCSYFDRDKINFMSYYLRKQHKFKIKDYFADLKSNPVPQARKVSWMSGWEETGLWQKPGGKLTYNWQLGQAKNYDMRPIVGHTTKADGERAHPTQKPISVASKFIAYWSNEGDLILDPFAGSGTTGMACIKLHRNIILIEKEKNYAEKMIERIKTYISQQNMFREATSLEIIDLSKSIDIK